MKIVKIIGGLGNQMFQYALYLSLQESFPDEKIMIDISNFKGYPLHNGFELDNIFKLNYCVATWRDIIKVAYPYPTYRCWKVGKYILPRRKTMCIEKHDFALDETVLQNVANRFFDGYWQNEYYFKAVKKKIHEAYIFPEIADVRNMKIMQEVKNAYSVAIHIRRGDYINHPYFRGICDLKYYRQAIEYITQKTKVDLFCIFSNDIKWCHEMLAGSLVGYKVVFVDWNKGRYSYVDMQLMSSCKHNIIANSSFSWWGAWLNKNPDKIVIAPDKWMNIQIKNDPISDNWIRIK